MTKTCSVAPAMKFINLITRILTETGHKSGKAFERIQSRISIAKGGKLMFFHRSCSLFLVVLLGALALCSCRHDNNGNNGPTEEPFTLAYVDTNWQLRIRWSEDGTNWSAAEGGNPSIDRAPGIAADATGVLYLAIFQDAVSDARMMMGLGPAVWDNSSRKVGDGHRGDIDSGTSIAHVEGEDYLVTFIHNNKAQVFEFDASSGARDFGADVTPVSGVTNNNLDDRPAIVNRNGRLIVSWLMTTKQVHMVTGNIVSGAPVWDAGYNFNTSEPGFLAPEGALDLAHDGESFYLAIVRERVPDSGQILKRFFLFIYTSTDGMHWTRLASREVKKPTAMSIAARAPDDIIAILSAPAYNKAFRYNGSNWTILNESAVFGANLNNAGHDLTLYAKD